MKGVIRLVRMASPFELCDAPVTALPGYRRTFGTGRMTLGLMLPIDAGRPETPDVDPHTQIDLIRKAEAAGVAAVYLRDIPLRDPDFGDVGQVWDPFVYLGYVAASTSEIAVGTAAVVVPVRHPLHLAKEAASVDRLSGGRFLFGVATGDRGSEFPAFGVEEGDRGEVFREHLGVMNRAWTTERTGIRWSGGRMWGGDIVPKPTAVRPPLITVGSCQQSMAWNAENSDAWLTYHRDPVTQGKYLAQWRELAGPDKPFAQSMSVDLHPDPDAPPATIKFGYRVGRNCLVQLLVELEKMGVDHVVLGFKRGTRPAPDMLDELLEYVVPTLALS